MGYIKNAVAYVAPGGAAYPATVAAVHMPATGIAAGSVLLAHPSTIPSAAAVIGYALIPGIGPLPFTAAVHSATPMDCDAHTSLNWRLKSKGAVVPAHANRPGRASLASPRGVAATVASVSPSRASTWIRVRREPPTCEHMYQDIEELLSHEYAYPDGEELPTRNLKCLPPTFYAEDMVRAADNLCFLRTKSPPDSPKNMDHDIHGAFNISSDGGASSSGGAARPIDSSGDERMASRKRGRTAAGSSGVDVRAPTNKRPRAGTYVPAVERARAAAPRAASPARYRTVRRLARAPPAPPRPLTPKQKQNVTEALIFISGIVSTPEGPVRRLLGNSPDTSKALRHMRTTSDLVTRTGKGGKKDPYVWTLTPAGMAAAAAVTAAAATAAAAAAAAAAAQAPAAVAQAAAAPAGP
ncbi:hypothetical protein FOA52_014082 [Chlamydomonas sp. UWO 241]|nr:hypothetical protein FOA52_014082 [Chlamydomonas sp. UWO 241]